MRPTDPQKRLVDGGAQSEGEQGASELLGRAGPVPQDDDLARERVWRALAKELPGKRERRPVRWVLVGSVAAAVVAVVVGYFIQIRDPAYARLELTAGPVFTSKPAQSWKPAEAGQLLSATSRIKTDASSRALVRLHRSAVLISSDSDVGIESLAPDTFLRLSGGEVLAEVEHRASGESFVVQTTRYKVTVKGTVFSVHERAPDDVTVSVSRGLVEVSGEGGVWQVPAGKAWHSRTADVLGADEITANDRALVASASGDGEHALVRVESASGGEVSEGGLVLGPSPVTWRAPVGQYHFTGAGSAEGDATVRSGNPTLVALRDPSPRHDPSPQGEGARRADEGATHAAPPSPEPAPEPDHVTAPPPPSRHHDKHKPAHHDRVEHATSAPHETPPPPAETRADNPAATSPQPERPLHPTPDAVTESHAASTDHPARAEPQAGRIARSDETPPIAEPPPTSRANTGTATGIDRPAPPPAPPTDPYTDALNLERDRRYDEAAQLFARVADAHGPRSAAALYELARLQQLNLHQPDRALGTFERYQREYPKGTLTQEVEISVIEIELQQRSYDDALTRMNTFLSRHSDSERASEVHLLRADVLRDRGQCNKALDDYAKAHAPAQADDALYFTAWCVQKTGDRDDAEKSFRAYLDRFPSGRHAKEARAALGEK